MKIKDNVNNEFKTLNCERDKKIRISVDIQTFFYRLCLFVRNKRRKKIYCDGS